MTGQRRDGASSLTVVSGLLGQRRYLEACRKDAEADRRALHKRYVVDPYWARCAAGGELESFASIRGLVPIANLAALESEIRQLAGEDLNGLLTGAFGRISTILSGPPTTVWVLAGDPDDRFTTGLAGGVNGTTAGSGKIWLHLIPMAGWLDRIPGALAHEHHHSVWLARHYRGDESQTLLNYLVMEGQACMFASLLNPSNSQPWTQVLTGDQERDVWMRMKPHLASSSHQMMAAFMFGGIEGLPPLCGYTIGYRIMEAYLRQHVDADVRGWTDLDAGTLLSQSEYGSRF